MTKLASLFMRGAMVAGMAIAVAVAPSVALAKPKVAALGQARVDAAEKVYAVVEAQWRAGRGTIDGVCTWSVRWLDAARDQPHTRKALAAALDAHHARMVAVETDATRQVSAGVASVADAQIAAYYVVEAELWVARGE